MYLPEISVIVPVYNVEDYLEQCIDSILNQTLKNIQIILVDDGSTDSSGVICDQYMEKDSRIIVIHQENVGVSEARNVGLKIANGRFIAFVDSDDILAKDAYEKLLRNAVENSLIIGRIQRISEDGKLLEESKRFNVSTVSQKEFLFDLFEEKKYGYLGFPVDKLFDRKIIKKNNICFQTNIKLNEDRLFVMQYLFYCETIFCCNDIVYFYRQRSNGVITSTRRNKTVTDSEMTVILSFEEMQRLGKKYSDELYFVICRKSFECALDLLNRVAKSDKTKIKILKEFMKSSVEICLENPKEKLINKIKLISHCILLR